jgi:ABC-type uncharacterized transport system substrate-binding protein
MFDIRRREFIALLGGAAVSWPLAARAQQSGGLRRIGVLMITPESDPEGQTWVRVFREELQKLGWTEGRNISTDIRWWTPRDVEALPRLAKEFVAQQPDLILSQGTPSTVALLKETRTIPIIFGIAADPIGSGFVASFQRPGGNATGFIVTEPTISGKWVELLKEIAPGVVRVAILFNPTTATYSEYWLKSFRAAAASFALKAIEAPVRNRGDLDSAIAHFKTDARTRTSLDIDDVIQEALAVVRDRLRAHRVAVRADPDKRLPRIRGEQVQLQQVLVNLFTSAIDSMATKNGERLLSIRSDHHSGCVMVSVEDTGIGLEPSAVDRIFNPMFTTKTHGMGMGLSICRSIIEAHSGQLWVTAEEGRGAIFHFTVPVEPGNPS